MGTLVKPLPHPYESGEASKLRWYRILRPLRGSRLVPWEEEMTADWRRLTMRTHWVGNRSTLSAQLELTVTDEEAGGAVLLRLQGGYVDNGRGGQTIPSDPVITAAGATSRAVCKLRAQDAWSWTLQQMRPGSGASDIECSVCMSPFHEPVRFPAQPGSACGHIFCRGCVVRCLAAEHQKRASGGPAESAPCCPLCRAPLAEGVTAEAARSLPVDAEAAAQVEAEVLFHSAPFAVNYVSNSPTTWTAVRDGDSTLPQAISVAQLVANAAHPLLPTPPELSAWSQGAGRACTPQSAASATWRQWPQQRDRSRPKLRMFHCSTTRSCARGVAFGCGAASRPASSRARPSRSAPRCSASPSAPRARRSGSARAAASARCRLAWQLVEGAPLTLLEDGAPPARPPGTIRKPQAAPVHAGAPSGPAWRLAVASAARLRPPQS